LNIDIVFTIQMKRHYRILVLFIYLLFFSSLSFSQKVDSILTHKADSLFRRFARNINNRALVVGLYYKGVDTLLAYGRINLFGRIPNGEDLFEIGSVSKTFTGFLFAKQIVDGEIDMNHPVSKYLDIKKKVKYDSTSLLSLATHTSGLINNTLTLFPITLLSYYVVVKAFSQLILIPLSAPAAFVWIFVVIPPPIPFFSTYGRSFVNFDLNLFKPKPKRIGKFKYSNFGMGLLGRVLAENKKLSYEELLQNDLCSILNLENTTTAPSKIQKKLYATPHYILGIRTTRTKLRKGGIEGAGGIKTTGKDMLKYLRVQLDSSYIPNILPIIGLQQQTFYVSKDPKHKGLEMGLGWIKSNAPEEGKSKIIWHNGQVMGSSAFIGFIPDKQIGIFILANNRRGRKLTKLGFEILNYFN